MTTVPDPTRPAAIVALQDKLVDLWWTRVPTALGRASRSVGLLFSDGLYVVAWPPVAAFLPPVLLLVGLVFGWLHPLADGELYSGSLLLLAAMTLIPQFGAAFGIWTGLGYVIGDFVLSRHPQASESCFLCVGVLNDIIRIREPMVLSYVLLLALIVFVPFMATTLRRVTLGRWDSGAGPWLIVRAGLQALIQGLLVLVWTNAYPPLIRPFFTWRGYFPDLPSITSVQVNGGVLVGLGIAGGLGRVLLEAWANRSQVGAAEAIRSRLAHIVGTVPRTWSRLPLVLSAAIRGALLTLLIAGLIDGWLEAALVFAVFAGSIVLRRALLRVPMWTELITRVPLVARLLIGAAASYGITTLVLENTSEQVAFYPVVISIAASVVVMALLLPSASPPARLSPGPPKPPAPNRPVATT
jgi:hypothetical protein